MSRQNRVTKLPDPMRKELVDLRLENKQLKEEIKLKDSQIDGLIEDALLIRKILSHHGIVLGGESVEARRAELRRQAKFVGVFDRRTK